MLRQPYLFSALLFLFACGSEKDKHETRTYVDTRLFIETEIQHLTAAHIKLQKGLEFNGSSQTIFTAKPDWRKELDAFLTIDLHKVNYRGRFDADTVILGDTAFRIIYTANDDKLPLRSCTVTCTKTDGRISTLEALSDNRNSLYNSSRKLEYTAGVGYRISGTQQVRLGNNIAYEIRGNLINP